MSSVSSHVAILIVYGALPGAPHEAYSTGTKGVLERALMRAEGQSWWAPLIAMEIFPGKSGKLKDQRQNKNTPIILITNFVQNLSAAALCFATRDMIVI